MYFTSLTPHYWKIPNFILGGFPYSNLACMYLELYTQHNNDKGYEQWSVSRSPPARRTTLVRALLTLIIREQTLAGVHCTPPTFTCLPKEIWFG